MSLYDTFVLISARRCEWFNLTAKRAKAKEFNTHTHIFTWLICMRKKCIRAQVEVGKSVNYFSQSTPKGLFTHVDIVNTPRVAQQAVCLCLRLCAVVNETVRKRERWRIGRIYCQVYATCFD